MSIESALKDMEKWIGKEVFVSDWTEVTQEQINQFADSTKDHQWIHVDPEKAAKGPFGKTIAHGFLTLSHLPFFSYQVPLKGPKWPSITDWIRCASSPPWHPVLKSATGLSLPAWNKNRETGYW